MTCICHPATSPWLTRNSLRKETSITRNSRDYDVEMPQNFDYSRDSTVVSPSPSTSEFATAPFTPTSPLSPSKLPARGGLSKAAPFAQSEMPKKKSKRAGRTRRGGEAARRARQWQRKTAAAAEEAQMNALAEDFLAFIQADMHNHSLASHCQEAKETVSLAELQST